MKKRHFILLSALILVAVGIAGGIAKTTVQTPTNPGGILVTSFEVARPSLRPGERTSIRVSASNNADDTLTYAWKVEAGALSAQDTNPVIWTAPESEGHYQVSVEVTNAAGLKSKGSAGFLVSKYPATSLIISAEPKDCKTVKE